MPTKLPSGLVVYNVTPHPISFWCGVDGIVVARSDGVVSAKRLKEVLSSSDYYEVVKVTYDRTEGGKRLVEKLRKENPKALIVGSIIAAKAYDEIVAPLFIDTPTSKKLVSSKQFCKENM